MHYSAHITDTIYGKTVIGPIRATPLNAIKIAVKIARPIIGNGPFRGDVYEHRTIIHKGIETNEESVQYIDSDKLFYNHYERYSQNGTLFLTAFGEYDQDLNDQVKDLMRRNKRRYA